MSGQSYQNFADPSFKKDWRRAYYGANYDRLRAVKTQLDRQGLCRFEQGYCPGMSTAPRVGINLAAFWHDPYPTLKRRLDAELVC